MDHPIIGAPLPRSEDQRLLRGRGHFVADLRLPGTLTAAFLRSPHAHARVLGIDAAAAAALPGVHGVWTALDLGAANQPLPMMVPAPGKVAGVTQRPLATDRVCYAGEAVAVVLADDRYVAEDALDQIAVTYEALPALVDPRAALTAPPRHPGCADIVGARWQDRVGDPAAAFAAADVVVSGEIGCGRATSVPMEGRGVLAAYDPVADLLTVWSSTQVPHRIRGLLAERFGRPEESVRVVAPDVGGGFGSKLCLYPEEVLCAWLALQTGQPVQWTEDRSEHFLATAHGRGQVHALDLALGRDGTILAVRDRFVHDNGAYAAYAARVPTTTMYCLTGPYRIANWAAEFVSVFTNKVPVIPYRGSGRPEAALALERLIDRGARALGLEPAAVRRRNLVRSFPHNTGLVYPGRGPMIYDSGDYEGLLSDVLSAIDLPAFRAEQAAARTAGRYLGFGLGCNVESTAEGAYEGAVVRVDNSGTVSVTAGICAQGQGHETMLAQVCAALLEIPMERVQVRLGDTARIPYGVGTWGSRGAVAGGSAVWAAVQQVRAKAVAVAARLLEAAPEDITWAGGAAHVAGAPERRLTLAELARAAASPRGKLPVPGSPGLEATHYYNAQGLPYAAGVHAAVVEVDPATGVVQIRRYVVAHDCGVVLNAAGVEGQVVGGVAQGIGGALLEEVVYGEGGELVTGSLMDYLLPTALDVPTLELYHRETPSPVTPFGLKGAGEGGVIPVAAAITGAVEDALGIEVNSIPLTPDRLHALLQRRAGGVFRA